MEIVLLTAIGVGLATVIGAIIGLSFKNLSHRFSDIVLAFAAGVMLAAAVLGLILPAVEYGGQHGLWITVAGVFAGAICLNLTDKLVPHLHKLSGGVSYRFRPFTVHSRRRAGYLPRLPREAGGCRTP